MRMNRIGLVGSLLVAGALTVACGSEGGITPAPTPDSGTADAGATDEGVAIPDPGTTDPGPATPDPGPAIEDDGPPPDDGKPPADEGPQTECEPGFAFCNGAILFTCKEDGSGYEQKNCAKGCAGDHCNEACKVGETICMSKKSMGVCQADGTYEATPCGKDEECIEDGGAGKCELKICEPDELYCDEMEKGIFKCSDDGKKTNKVKECPYGCDPKTAECLDPNCTPGFVKCNPEKTTLLTCKADGSGFEAAASPCKWKCLEGECIEPICMPEQTKCGEKAILICAEDQLEWLPKKTCQIGCAMDGETAVCAQCVEGKASCDGWDVMECIDPVAGPEFSEQCDWPLACAGGQCIDVIFVGEEDPAKQAAYLDIMKGLSDCFKQGIVGVCGGLNTESIDYDVSLGNLEGWLCEGDEGTRKPLFESGSQYDWALDVLGCGSFDVSDLTLKTGSIHGGLDAIECYGFEKGGFNDKEVVVDYCDLF